MKNLVKIEKLINNEQTMSSKEIAEIAGKLHKNVLAEIRLMEPAWEKITGLKFQLSEYTDTTGRKLPCYELTRRECLYVATKFNDEARAKLIVRWEELELDRRKPMSTLDILTLQVQLLHEQEKKMSEIDGRISNIEQRILTDPEFYAIPGYASLIGKRVNLKEAQVLGRKATKLCEELGIITDSIPDPRFGRVKTYPIEVLQEVFEEVE